MLSHVQLKLHISGYSGVWQHFSCFQSSFSLFFFVSMSISFCLCLFLDLLYYLCPAPSATPRSRVSPVGPDDILRLLLLSYTRKGSGRYTPTCMHTYKYTPAGTLAFSHTQLLKRYLSEEDSVKSVSCWLREVVVNSSGYWNLEEEAPDNRTSWTRSVFVFIPLFDCWGRDLLSGHRLPTLDILSAGSLWSGGVCNGKLCWWISLVYNNIVLCATPWNKDWITEG